MSAYRHGFFALSRRAMHVSILDLCRLAPALGFVLTGTACIINNPDHCHNLAGDETCAMKAGGGFCSRCAANNFGCVAAMPEEQECRSPFGMSGATDGTGSPGTTTDMMMTTDPTVGMTLECEGGNDDMCSSAAPYCVGGTCMTCDDAGGDAFCGGHDASTPACFAGDCYACAPGRTDACPDNTFCHEDLSCGGCTEHEQCASGVCNLAKGTCMAPLRIWHVDNRVCPEVGFGTQNDPYCDLGTALANIDAGEEGAIKLVGATDREYTDAALDLDLSSSSKTVVVVGVGGARPVIHREAAEYAASVGPNDQLVLSNVEITRRGLLCSEGSLWLHDSIVRGADVDGIAASRCEVVLHDAQVVGSARHGVFFEENTDQPLVLRNAVVAGNGATGEQTAGVLLNLARADITYSTIAFNRGGSEGSNWQSGLRCLVPLDYDNGNLVEVRNSIIVGTSEDAVACPWGTYDHNLIDTNGLHGTGNFVVDAASDVWFADAEGLDFRIVAGTPAEDVAVWNIGDPWVDINGTPRPLTPGATDYAGADRP